jgi:hypothetical protein
MRIGNVELNGQVALAPMAGVADRAFREICVDFGASYVVSEMVSAKGLHHHSKKSAELMTLSERERPAAIQLFGDDPATMAEAAKFALSFGPNIIDINMNTAGTTARGRIVFVRIICSTGSIADIGTIIRSVFRIACSLIKSTGIIRAVIIKRTCLNVLFILTSTNRRQHKHRKHYTK